MGEGGSTERRPAMAFIAEELALELVRKVRDPVERIQKRDRDLANQIRRAAKSVVSNLSEVAQRVGQDRLHLYRISAGSAAELRSALNVASAWGYVGEGGLDEAMVLIRRVLAIVWKLTHPV